MKNTLTLAAILLIAFSSESQNADSISMTATVGGIAALLAVVGVAVGLGLWLGNKMNI